jgi:DNA (cytosine-5)-methyltransferase 1
VIPIIDIFAGPGGLGEGFSSVLDENGESLFKIKLSIEKEENAHRTLRLRAFFRQFKRGDAPNEYYQVHRLDSQLRVNRTSYTPILSRPENHNHKATL